MATLFPFRIINPASGSILFEATSLRDAFAEAGRQLLIHERLVVCEPDGTQTEVARGGAVSRRIVAQPGDGTRYELLVVVQPRQAILVVWEAMGYLWRVDGGGLVLLAYPPSNARGKTGRAYDTKAVLDILRAHKVLW